MPKTDFFNIEKVRPIGRNDNLYRVYIVGLAYTITVSIYDGSKMYCNHCEKARCAHIRAVNRYRAKKIQDRQLNSQ